MQQLVVIVGGNQPGRGCIGIATAPGISRDPSCVARCGFDGTWACCVVVQRADDDRSCPRHRNLHATAQEDALLIAPLQILHLSGSAGSDPGREALGVQLALVALRSRYGRYSGRVEASLYGLFLHPLFEVRSPFARHQNRLLIAEHKPLTKDKLRDGDGYAKPRRTFLLGFNTYFSVRNQSTMS